MIKKITKSGNSAAITLDLALLEMIHAKIGDQVNIVFRNGGIFIVPVNAGFSEEDVDGVADELFSRFDKTFKKLAE